MKREKENTENYYEKELRMIKKEAENSIRYYKNLGKPFTLTVDTKNKENEFDAFDSQINYQDQNILMHSNEPSAILEPKTLNRVPSQFFETHKEENVIPQRHSVTRTASKLNTGLKRKPESAKLKRDPSRKALGEKIGFDNIQTTDAFESNEKGYLKIFVKGLMN